MQSATKTLFRRIALLCATLLLGLAAAAQAGDITLNADMVSGKNWNDTGYWSDGNGAAAGNEYWVGLDRAGSATSGKVVRTPMVDAKFPGDALHIGTGGTLAIKPNTTPTPTNVYTFDNLILTDGSVVSQYSDNTTGTINGKITMSGAVKWNVASANIRKFIINAQLLGTGTFVLSLDYAGNDDEIMLNNNTSTFSGTIAQYGGTVKLLSSTPLGNAGAYTFANSTNGPGILDPEVDVNCVNCALNFSANSRIKLDHKMIFKSVNANGTPIPAGYYTAAALQTDYASFFTNDGGVLIVGAPTPKISANSGATTVTFSDLNVLIQAGDKATQTVTVTNTGSADVTFTKQGSETYPGLVLSGSSLYKIKSVSQPTTQALAPNQSLTITLEFSGVTQSDYVAGGNNTKSGQLSIFSNASGQPRVDLALTGATKVPVELSTFSAQ